MLTDGIIEARDKSENEFGYERILKLIKHHRTETAEDIIDHIYTQLCDSVRESQHNDDITALICKVNDIHHH